MNKTIYINEDIANEISSLSNPLKELPNDIKNVLKHHKTSLGEHPAFPPEEELSFDHKVTLQRFKEVKDKMKSLGIEDYSENALSKELQDILSEIKEIELPYKDKLEKLCYNFVINMFDVPEGYVEFNCSLTEKVDDEKAPVDSTDSNIAFKSIKHMSKLSKEVYKRRLINALIIGASLRLSYPSKELIGEIYEINPKLPELYKKLMAINDYMLFVKNNMGISDKNKKQIGISYLKIGNDVNKSKIDSEGMALPILIYESIKGFMELFATYGLPSKKEDAQYVMKKADYINAEPWDMRLGPILWDIIYDTLDFPETKDLPNILLVLFSQKVDKFNEIMQEMFGLTNMGKKYAQKILDKVKEDCEEDEFYDRMKEKNTDSSIINDSEFFTEDYFKEKYNEAIKNNFYEKDKH